MQFTTTFLAVLATFASAAMADCGSTCYNAAGINGCTSQAVGHSICDQFWDGSSSCKYCVDVNCGGYGSTAQLADKAFCQAKGWGKRDIRGSSEARREETAGQDWATILDQA